MPSPVSLAIVCLSLKMTSTIATEVMQVYHSLRDYGLVLIQPKLRMDLDVAQRIVRDYMYLVRSIYIQSDQIAIVCFQTKDVLLQQTVQERFKVGLKSTLSHPDYPEFHLEVGYNTAVSQVQDEVLQDIAYATIHKETLEKFVHIDYPLVNPGWNPHTETRLNELPSTEELDELPST